MADNKDKKVLNVPALRFPEFTDEWQHILNKELFNPVSDKNKDKIITLILSASQTEGMIERNNIGIDIKFDENSVKNYKIVRTGDYVVHLRSFQGGFAFSELTGICSPAYTILRPNKQLQYGFLRAYFMSKKFIDSLRLVTYGIRDGKSISVEEWMQLYTNIPSDKEQDKIIKLFNILDERIKLQNKIIEDWKKLKSAIVEELYSATKGETYSFRQLLEVVNEKNRKLEYTNVLSASQELGMIKRSDINIDIKFEQDSICGYKIVRNGDYVVHLRSFQGGFAFSDKTGICSPAYTILRPNDLVVYGYLSHFFTSRLFIKSLKLVTYGIRDGRSINVDEWLNMTVILPTIQEQLHIIEIINSISSKLYNETRIYDSLLRQKSYLLKAMFI